MTRDAIIDEVRAIRDDIAKECGYDVHELFAGFRRLEAANPKTYVSLPARRVDPADEQPEHVDG